MRYTLRRNRTFFERLYKANVLPDGNLRSIEPIEVVIKKLEDPPFDDEETDKGTL